MNTGVAVAKPLTHSSTELGRGSCAKVEVILSGVGDRPLAVPARRDGIGVGERRVSYESTGASRGRRPSRQGEEIHDFLPFAMSRAAMPAKATACGIPSALSCPGTVYGTGCAGSDRAGSPPGYQGFGRPN